MDLGEVVWGMDWIGLDPDRNRWRALFNAVMKLGVSQNAGNFVTSCRPVSFTATTRLS